MYDINITNITDSKVVYQLDNKLCTGIYKTVQIFNNLFLRKIGSSSVNRELGTNFYSKELSNNNSKTYEISNINLSIDLAIQQMEKYYNSDILDNEKIISGYATDVSKNGLNVLINVSLNTASGESIELVLPV